MGMFDDVLLDDGVELPDGYEGRAHQTKDFECVMDHFRLTTEGRLLREVRDWRALTEEERKAYKTYPIAPIWTSTHVRWDDTGFHGVLNFYDLDTNGHPGGVYEDWRWHEYDAKFTDGQLVEIVARPKESNQEGIPRS